MSALVVHQLISSESNSALQLDAGVLTLLSGSLESSLESFDSERASASVLDPKRAQSNEQKVRRLGQRDVSLNGL